MERTAYFQKTSLTAPTGCSLLAEKKKTGILISKEFSLMLFSSGVLWIFLAEKFYRNLSSVQKIEKGIHLSLVEDLKADTNQSQLCIFLSKKKKSVLKWFSWREMIFSNERNLMGNQIYFLAKAGYLMKSIFPLRWNLQQLKNAGNLRLLFRKRNVTSSLLNYEEESESWRIGMKMTIEQNLTFREDGGKVFKISGRIEIKPWIPNWDSISPRNTPIELRDDLLDQRDCFSSLLPIQNDNEKSPPAESLNSGCRPILELI